MGVPTFAFDEVLGNSIPRSGRIWVGLPSQRGAKGSADSSYLNEIYRSRADKAGITYVDIWDGFVDEGGRFSKPPARTRQGHENSD